ncbi:MAG: hypothetical protein JRJ01_01095 [Deltaproteobacteria bacterium]|nr:hypothetical protein [Deltaproteobacteria bacterium]
MSEDDKKDKPIPGEDDETGDISERGETRGETPEDKSRPGRLKRWTSSLRRRPWITVGVATFLFLGVGLGVTVTQGKRIIPGETIRAAVSPHLKDPGKDYYEEKLRPLLLPLPSGSENQAVLIKFSVIWDGLTSFRYRALELQIRNRLYTHMKSLVAREQDPQDKTPLLEAEMSRILRESLGTGDLAIKIKEVKGI